MLALIDARCVVCRRDWLDQGSRLDVLHGGRCIAHNSKAGPLHVPVAASHVSVSKRVSNDALLLEVAVVADRVRILELVVRCLLLRVVLLFRQLFPVLGVVERANVEEERGEEARDSGIDGEQPSFALLAGNVEVLNKSTDH